MGIGAPELRTIREIWSGSAAVAFDHDPSSHGEPSDSRQASAPESGPGRLTFRQWAWAIGAVWAVVPLCSILWVVFRYGVRFVSPDVEFQFSTDLSAVYFAFPALASGLLLVLAALLTWATAPLYGGRAAWAVRGLSIALAWMSLDELLGLHESLETATGIDWQLLYLPLVALIALPSAVLLWHQWHRARAAAAMFVAGGVCWAVAQVLEFLEWDGDVSRPGYLGMMVVEECLEALGSALFAWSALVVLRSAAHARARRSQHLAP